VKCPFCGHLGDKVVDSRESREGEVIRRRRECLGCGRRFTSYERIEDIPYMVVKKDGTRERFERGKVIAGMLKACEKRPVTVSALEAIADKIEAAVQDRSDRELSTAEVGAAQPAGSAWRSDCPSSSALCSAMARGKAGRRCASRCRRSGGRCSGLSNSLASSSDFKVPLRISRSSSNSDEGGKASPEISSRPT